MFFKLPVSRKQLYIYKGLLLAVKSSGKQYVLVYVCVCVCVCKMTDYDKANVVKYYHLREPAKTMYMKSVYNLGISHEV